MKWYYWLGSILFVLLGFWTLIPAEAGKPCLLGYYAHCSFTPISTMNAPITEKAYFVEDTYPVTFTQSGLPSGTNWSVTFGGTKKSSTSSTITFKVKSGNYSWSVSTPVSGGTGIRYVASPESGSMKVPSYTSQSITYTKQYKLTISATSGGSTNPDEGSYWYDSESNVTISASPSRQFKAYLEAHGQGSRIWATFSPSSGTPKFTSTLELRVQSDASPGDYAIQVLAYGEGYKFDRWVLDNSSASSNSSTTITMNDPHTLKAIFYKPCLKVSLSKSSILILQGETGDLMVTVTETSTDHQNHPTFTLTVEASTLGSPIYYGWVWDPWPRIHYFVHGRIVAESNVSADVEAVFHITASFVSFTRNATAECKENGEFYIDIYAFDFNPRLKKIILKVTKEGCETETFTLTISPSQPSLVYEPVIFIAVVAALILISLKRQHRKAEKQKKNLIFPG